MSSKASKRVAPAPKVAGGTGGTGASSKKGAAGKKKDAAPKKTWKESHSHLFIKDPRNFRIGGDLRPGKNLSRLVKWPKYIRLQRQRAIMKKRLKIPPAIHQFAHTLEKNHASNLFRLLSHYQPETFAEKKKRLLAQAKTEVKGTATEKEEKQMLSGTKPCFLKFGLNHITKLVEKRKAKLVIMAHDVDPVELVVWLPALCRKQGIPFCIVKGKARLGKLVHLKTATAVAVTDVRKDDSSKLDQIIQAVKPMFNDNVEVLKRWGGGILGAKSQAVVKKQKKVAAREAAKTVKSGAKSAAKPAGAAAGAAAGAKPAKAAKAAKKEST